MIKKILTIAGSDTSGGAGIQADLKTFQIYETYGMSTLTVIVAMEPETWAHQVFPLDIQTIEAQLKTNLLGIKPDALKTGMLPTVQIIELVGSYLKNHGKQIPIVIDPVMACKGEKPLFPENTQAMIDYLLPFATVVTPNLFEAAQLAGMPTINTLQEAKHAAIAIHGLGAKYVVIKAVPYDDELVAELVFDGHAFGCFTHPLFDNVYNHGAGCTFSASIAAQLGKQKEPLQAIADASAFVVEAIKQSEPLNTFAGAIIPKK